PRAGERRLLDRRTEANRDRGPTHRGARRSGRQQAGDDSGAVRVIAGAREEPTRAGVPARSFLRPPERPTGAKGASAVGGVACDAWYVACSVTGAIKRSCQGGAT